MRENSLLHLHAESIKSAFPLRPLQIEHELVGHPLLQIESIIELSQKLPEECIEYNAGNLPIDQDPQSTPMTGLTAQQTLERIQSCESWMVLKYVEKDPKYKSLLKDCLAEVQPHLETLPMYGLEGFIFITSPNSITPYHVDPEHNFLLQIRGSKEMHVFDGTRDEVISQPEIEAFFTGAHRNLTYRDKLKEFDQTFRLEPGQGLHVPLFCPHWVKNGPEVSISFSITFRSPISEKRMGVHKWNHWLRSKGWNPQKVGQNPITDELKYFFHRVSRRL